MKTIVLFLIAFFSINISFISADELVELSDTSVDKNILKAVIDVVDSTKLNKGVFFDASQSIVPKDETVSYQWDLGDGTLTAGQQVIHKYSKSGIYDIVLTIKTLSSVSSATAKLWIYDKSFLVLTDGPSLPIDIYSIGAKNGVLIEVKNIFDAHIDMSPSIMDARHILFYVYDITNLPFFLALKNKSVDFTNKELFISFKNNDIVSTSFIGNIFNLLGVSHIIKISTDIISQIITDKPIDEILYKMRQNGVSYQLYDEFSVSFSYLNFFSYVLNYMIFKGVSASVIYTLLLLPLIVTLIAFLRHIVGISNSGVYLPSILTVIFISLGIVYGIFLTFIIYLFVYFYRLFSKNLKLYVAPYTSFMIILLTLFIYFIFGAGIYFGIVDPSYLGNSSLFPILILILSSERFMHIQIDKGFVHSVYILIDTIFVAFVTYITVSYFSFFKTLILMYPEFIFMFLILNFMIGKYKGLRMMEMLHYSLRKY